MGRLRPFDNLEYQRELDSALLCEISMIPAGQMF